MLRLKCNQFLLHEVSKDSVQLTIYCIFICIFFKVAIIFATVKHIWRLTWFSCGFEKKTKNLHLLMPFDKKNDINDILFYWYVRRCPIFFLFRSGNTMFASSLLFVLCHLILLLFHKEFLLNISSHVLIDVLW